jgi:PA14 domain/Dolichyl-phosphate-mannose-protein mannosyltransferase
LTFQIKRPSRRSLARWSIFSLRLVLLLGGVWLAIKGQGMLDDAVDMGHTQRFHGLWHLLGGGALIAAALGTFRNFYPNAEPLPRKWTNFTLILILALAALLRFYDLDDYPPGLYYDEVINIEDSMRISEKGEHFLYSSKNFGRTALYFYHIAAMFKAFGVSDLSARAASALTGVFSVLITFLLARRMFDVRAALIAALLLAGSRWHINFSRIVFAGIQVTLWGPLALYFVWRSVESLTRMIDRETAPPAPVRISMPCGKAQSGKVKDGVAKLVEKPTKPRRKKRDLHYLMTALVFAFAGFFTILNYYSYGAARAIPALVFAFLLVYLVIDRRFLPRFWPYLILMAAIAAVSYYPLDRQFKSMPGAYNVRVNEVKLIKPELPVKQVREKLVENSLRTFMMFNFIGDGNHRHNLSGHRMLQFLCAILLPAGLLIALLNWRHPRYFLCILWFLIAALPGVLSTQAPHALRLIGIIPVLYLIVADVLRRIWHLLTPLVGLRNEMWLTPLFAYICLSTTFFNAHTYFNVQMPHKFTWENFHSIYTLTARHIMTIDRSRPTQVYCNDYQHQNIKALLYEHKDMIQGGLHPNEFLRGDSEKDQVFVQVWPDKRRDLLANIPNFFPNCEEQVVFNAYNEKALLVYRVSSEEFKANQGLSARYIKDGTVVLKRVDRGAYLANMQSASLQPPFEVEWEGVLALRHSADTSFHVDTNGEVEILIDREKWASDSPKRLLEGYHRIIIRLRIDSGSPRFSLTWDRSGQSGGKSAIDDACLNANPLPDYGLREELYDRPNWTGRPDMKSIASSIDYEWVKVPLRNRYFSVIWTGYLLAPEAGSYQIATRSRDTSKVIINGKEVINITGQDGRMQSTNIQLEKGPHPIEVRYSDTKGYSMMKLYWRRPGKNQEIISREYLRTGS